MATSSQQSGATASLRALHDFQSQLGAGSGAEIFANDVLAQFADYLSTVAQTPLAAIV
jgi:hypothetical protein